MGWFISNWIYERHETPMNISSCRFINNQEGMYNYYTGYYSNRLNVVRVVYLLKIVEDFTISDYSGGSFANCSFIDNENEGIYINPSFSWRIKFFQQ